MNISIYDGKEDEDKDKGAEIKSLVWLHPT
jgi:hypothetical protein